MLLTKYYLHRAILLFSMALILSVAGLLCRSNSALSLFWPANAIILGLMIRFPQLNSSRFGTPAIYAGMVLADIAFGTRWDMALGMDLANLLFIVVGHQVLVSRSLPEVRPLRLQALIRTFPAAVLGSAVTAAVGALAGAHYYHGQLLQGWISWFCEQFSTALLMLPLMITIPRRDELAEFTSSRFNHSPLPLLALLLSAVMGVYVGGGGSLLFPLPALMWCAISYPLFITCLLTLFTGGTEIMRVASNVLNIQGTDDFFRIDSIASARLGVAAMTISPLIVALSATANRKLVARITQRADFDFLTGALTRSGLSQKLETLVNPKNKPRRFSGTAFVVDIDHFKKVNDTQGHAAGDVVLAKTVECIRATLQPDAIVSRMGGEEFLILLEGLSQPRASLLAERLRAAIAANTMLINGHDLSVTVSIGTCEVAFDNINALDESIAVADEQLYIAKTSGRNRVSPAFTL